MDRYNFRERGNVNYKDKSTSPESESAVSDISVGQESVAKDFEQYRITQNSTHDHSYSKQSDPTPSTSHTAVAKCKSKDKSQSSSENQADVDEEKNPKPVPKPSQSQQPDHDRIHSISSNSSHIEDTGDANETDFNQSSSSCIQSIDKLSQNNVKKTDSTNKMLTTISENTNNTQSNDETPKDDLCIPSSRPTASHSVAGGQPSHHFDFPSTSSQKTPPNASPKNPASRELQSQNVSSSSDELAEKMNSTITFTDKEHVDSDYNSSVEYLKETASNAKAALEAKFTAKMDALKAKMDALKAKLKAKMNDVDLKFKRKMEKVELVRKMRLEKIMDDEENKAKRRKLDDDT